MEGKISQLTVSARLVRESGRGAANQGCPGNQLYISSKEETHHLYGRGQDKMTLGTKIQEDVKDVISCGRKL